MKRKISLCISAALLAVGFIIAFQTSEIAVDAISGCGYTGSSITELLRYLLR